MPAETSPVPPLPGTTALRIARLAAFSALGIVGRVAFLWAPNVALTYLVVFGAGVADGALAGAAVGLIAMTVTNLALSGLHPVLLANGPAMALLGVLGGLLRPWLLSPAHEPSARVLRITVLATAGLLGTLLFSVASDLASYAIQFLVAPEGAAYARAVLGPLLLAGLAFNLVPALVNAALFATVTPGLLRVLSRLGHVRPVAKRAGPSATPTD